MDRTNSYRIMGIIGARSGSKGVPHKNIQLLGGKPLLGRIVETAKQSKYINRVVVSTDSEEYAKVARQFGADTPFLRPAELATDNSPEIQYVEHAVAWLNEHEGYRPDIVVRMMATVPFQTVDDIDSCIEKLLHDVHLQSAVVVAEARQHPHKALKIMQDGKGGEKLVTYITESGRDVTPLGRYSYEKAYFRANVIACKIEVITDLHSLTGDRVTYHIIPQERAIDIDTPIDFFIAEQLMLRWDGVDDRRL